MCLTFAGRIQTRLIGLASVIGLTWLYARLSDKPDYWIVFWLMLAIGCALDLSVYGWLIGYQPRWLTLLLAAAEFLLLKWIMEWPYPFEIRLRTRQALSFYLLGWSLIWLMLYVILPRCLPRWLEDNGELIRFPRVHAWPQPWLETLKQRRQIYGVALLSLMIALLPWIVAYGAAPVGAVTTGLLLNDTGHLAALAEAVAVLQGAAPRSVSGWLGRLAALGHWPLLPLYYSVWIAVAFGLLLGLAVGIKHMAGRQLLLIGICLPWLPLPWLIFTAAVVWLVAALPLRSVARSQRRVFTIGLLIGAICTWSYTWFALASAPLLYLNQGTWQALIWFQQSVPPGPAVAAAPELQPALAGLGGQVVAPSDALAQLSLTSGMACEQGVVRFRHASICVIVPPLVEEARQ